MYQREYTLRGRAWVNSLATSAQGRARKAAVPFDRAAVKECLQSAPDVCPALGIIFELGHGSGKASTASPTLDRLIPELGYVRGNLAVISKLANMIKTSATPEQVEAVAAWLRGQLGP